MPGGRRISTGWRAICPTISAAGGLCRGKQAALARLGLIVMQFDCLHFDPSDLMIRKERAGLEIPPR